MAVRIKLKPGREKSLERRHPWVFSNGIHNVKGKLEAGDTVDVVAHDGHWLGRGAWSPESQIQVRIWTFDREEEIDREFFKRRILRAQAGRDDLIREQGLTGYRLIAAESDGLPGITIDKYANVLVCQLLSMGADVWRDTIVDVLAELYPDCAIYERSDVDSRKKEGLASTMGLLHGTLPEMPVIIEENGIKIAVDVTKGHKTGFYLDQRDNRAMAARFVKGKSVLNCFCYTGTFGLYAAKAGAASIENVDVSALALDTARLNMRVNGLNDDNVHYNEADVFKLLRQYRDEGKTFDVIVLDPPKFADNKSQLNGACRGYKDINMIALQLLNPGGVLLTFSCSGLMPADLFQKIVADAALDAKREIQFIERLSQASDHPIGSAFPEGFYLKGLVARVW
ncbi:SAM-dependent methyltransferase [Shewanella sp. MR-4]|uniref:Ribosomal RNA large subunit methyltransferase I n=1 Tax=Shewanella sp. (strain MR-4) TaxID=60480 RepID=RLMI_SHESM|nr:MULTISPECIES: class I SAM-dependent methyltransferase [unclassified Shewanella]Q0HLL4.1 RecName: Full=Ribosomal RNA large subunit methyltransferase I; AltName: Full=23S rRNA m5C1962 methyltransferase; AltName: Full=rRNA (cytosine-C(5)-)-methyltransferase RlmI [Shewanella sp. MR-4]ABI38053.1 SAM-dependent methyltransferase [Shewanella sp. MR-4]PWF62888.1 ribosomal RNA large subunit methyltransferase I [Shewanella sp. BC20]